MEDELVDIPISALMDERNDILDGLGNELKKFGKLTNQSLETEIKLIRDQSDFWKYVNQVANMVDSIGSKICELIENSKDIFFSNDQFIEMQNQHSLLENDLQNAKSMSRAIESRASIIRNQRITPILNLLWFMTSKKFNSEMLSQFDDLFDVLFQFIERAENNESNIAALGLLVNISFSSQGRDSLIKAFHRSPIPIIKKLFYNYELLCEPRSRQLVLLLVKNLIISDEICTDLIREGCIKFCSDYLDQLDSSSDPNDFQVINFIVDTLLDMKYIKTINFYCQNDLKKLYSQFRNSGDSDLKILSKIKDIANMQEEEQRQLKPKRFGVKRIYS